jgi:hypothetical protein
MISYDTDGNQIFYKKVENKKRTPKHQLHTPVSYSQESINHTPIVKHHSHIPTNYKFIPNYSHRIKKNVPQTEYISYMPENYLHRTTQNVPEIEYESDVLGYEINETADELYIPPIENYDTSDEVYITPNENYDTVYESYEPIYHLNEPVYESQYGMYYTEQESHNDIYDDVQTDTYEYAYEYNYDEGELYYDQLVDNLGNLVMTDSNYAEFEQTDPNNYEYQ